MAKPLKYMLPAMLALILPAWLGCTDPNAVIDQNRQITNRNWAYTNKVKFTVDITDTTSLYNLYINLRITGDYKYSNMFVLVHQRSPAAVAGGKSTSKRYELRLANPDGEWLGDGSGNLYSYQTLFKHHYRFPAKGVYTFLIEQNMRDNPLREVSDVGIRIEKATN